MLIKHLFDVLSARQLFQPLVRIQPIYIVYGRRGPFLAALFQNVYAGIDLPAQLAGPLPRRRKAPFVFPVLADGQQPVRAFMLVPENECTAATSGYTNTKPLW